MPRKPGGSGAGGGARRRGLGHDGADDGVGQQQAVDLLDHPDRAAAAQGPRGALAGLQPVERDLRLPAGVGGPHQGPGGCAAGVEQGGEQRVGRPVARPAGPPACSRPGAPRPARPPGGGGTARPEPDQRVPSRWGATTAGARRPGRAQQVCPPRPRGRHQVEAVQAPVPGDRSPRPTERSRRAAAGALAVGVAPTPASHTAWVPHRSARRPAPGPGARPPPARGAPEGPGVGRGVGHVPLGAVQRQQAQPERKAPGVPAVARGRQTRRNRATRGRAPSPPGRGQSPPRHPQASGAATATAGPHHVGEHRPQARVGYSPGPPRRASPPRPDLPPPCPRTPDASITASTAWARPRGPAPPGRTPGGGWRRGTWRIISRAGSSAGARSTSLPYRSQLPAKKAVSGPGRAPPSRARAPRSPRAAARAAAPSPRIPPGPPDVERRRPGRRAPRRAGQAPAPPRARRAPRAAAPGTPEEPQRPGQAQPRSALPPSRATSAAPAAGCRAPPPAGRATPPAAAPAAPAPPAPPAPGSRRRAAADGRRPRRSAASFCPAYWRSVSSSR